METTHIFLLGPSLFLLETLPSVKTRESRNTHSRGEVCEPKPIYHYFCQLFSFLVVHAVAYVTFNGPIKKVHSFVEGS